MFLPYLNSIDKSEESLDMIFKNLNNVLVFIGLGISFSTLQDTTKTQNQFSRRIWENPVKGKVVLLLFSLFTFFILGCGMYAYFSTENPQLEELSFGIIVFGIGFLGLLKSAIEMFENHRLDKK